MNKVVIDGKTYIPEDEALGAVSRGVAESFVGKNVIVRSRNEGINAGTVVAADRGGVVLKNARRLWYHKPANKSSWYEGVSLHGISSDSKVSAVVEMKCIIEDYSMTICTDSAFKQIMTMKEHEQYEN